MTDWYRIVARFCLSVYPWVVFYRKPPIFFAEFPTGPTTPDFLKDLNRQHRNLPEFDNSVNIEPRILSMNASSGECIMLLNGLYVVYIPLLVLGCPLPY